MNKIKILALCDSPTSATGFAQVSRNILRGLHRTGKYDIQVIGINYGGDYYDRTIHPYEIFPAQPQGARDMYGRDRLVSALAGQQREKGLIGPWDIIFTIQDPFIMEGLGLNYPFAEQLYITAETWRRTVPSDQWFKWVGYFPVDSSIKSNWVTKSIMLAHYPVAYCDYGKKEIFKYDQDGYRVPFNLKVQENGESKRAYMPAPSIKDRISVIPHGVDLGMFKPLPAHEVKQFRKEFWQGKVKDDNYLVVNISRNQPRKDIARTLAVFAEFKKKVPKAYLYLHMQANDLGGSIDELARNFNLRANEDYTVPKDFNAGNGFPLEVVNKIYNSADVCMTTTLGEGWGFITTEAMATKTPIVAPYITSIIDIFGGEAPSMDDLSDWFYKDGYGQMRGIPAKAGSTKSEWVCLGIEDNERIRPLTNVEDMAGKLEWAYNNKDKVKDMTERAYKWIQDYTWDKIVNKWDLLFTKAYDQLQKERKLGNAIDKTGRNELCPCGSGQKFKKCHGGERVKKLDELVDGA